MNEVERSFIMTKSHDSSSFLPEYSSSLWLETTTLPSYPPLQEELDVDVAIIGGGITGILTAFLLSKNGVKVALVEASTLMNGTTGHTTAKVTAQHDLIYDELIQHIGRENASLYYKANDEALQFFRDTINEHNIDCGWEEQDAYVYATKDETRSKLEQEWEAYQKLQIPGELTESVSLPFSLKGALKMSRQAQFHPLQFLSALLPLIEEKGGRIFENTKACNIEKGEKHGLEVESGAKIHCKKIVICSHYPFFEGKGLYYARMHAERSYVLAIKARQTFQGGMYISADSPKHSLRTTTLNGESLILLGGEGHKTGQGEDMEQHFEALRKWGDEVFGIEYIRYRWSAQDLITLDRIPFIGPVKDELPTILVATGFKKWGMTTSAVAAQMFADDVAGKESPYKNLYTPSRFHSDPSLRNFMKENTDVAKQLIKGKMVLVVKEIDELQVDEGAPVVFKGRRAGAYKEPDGTLHVLDTTCTHLRCEVEWNGAERSWDCPCHGSRFSFDGTILEGPAQEPLKRL
jgi:glycine/D-amino acid oxidase-like deaminating enzyme/nitrite reductase/ring-hydroxylating ferredoxin subunit